MKVFYIALMVLLAHSLEPLLGLPASFQSVESKLSTVDFSNPAAARDALDIEVLLTAINGDLIRAGGENWAAPSAARWEVVKAYGDIVEIHFNQLLNVAVIDRDFNVYDTNFIRLMKLSSPSVNVLRALQAEVEKNPDFEITRNEILLETGLFSDADRTRVVSTVSSATDEVWDKLLRAYADRGFDELAPFYEELLFRSRPIAGGYVDGEGDFVEGDFHYRLRLALKGLSHIGLRSKRVIEFLEDLLQEYDDDVLNIQVRVLCEECIEILNGNRPPLEKSAFSGRGSLSLSSFVGSKDDQRRRVDTGMNSESAPGAIDSRRGGGALASGITKSEERLLLCLGRWIHIGFPRYWNLAYGSESQEEESKSLRG
jgi:hypothetical protein